MYYIEETDKQRRLFNNKIKLNDNKLMIYGLNNEEKKSIAYAKRTNKILLKTNCNKLVLSKKIYENSIYKNMLYTYGYEIVEGKWLFESLIVSVFEYIIKKKQIKKEDCNISILVNNLNEYTFHNIKILAADFKRVNIVTNYMEKFKKLEEQFLKEKGLILTVMNNKKKSLTKSNIIINIDFSNEIVNKYNIFENAIIIDAYGNLKINKKRFNGIIINDFEISVKNEIIENEIGIDFEKYYIKQIYEATINRNIPYNEFIKKIKNDKCKIKKLYTNNTQI